MSDYGETRSEGASQLDRMSGMVETLVSLMTKQQAMIEKMLSSCSHAGAAHSTMESESDRDEDGSSVADRSAEMEESTSQPEEPVQGQPPRPETPVRAATNQPSGRAQCRSDRHLADTQTPDPRRKGLRIPAPKFSDKADSFPA